MNLNIHTNHEKSSTKVYCFFNNEDLELCGLEKHPRWDEISKKAKKLDFFAIEGKEETLCFQKVKQSDNKYRLLENFREIGSQLAAKLESQKVEEVALYNSFKKKKFDRALTEGLVLSLYQFDKYKSEKKENSLQKIALSNLNQEEVEELSALLEGVCHARDLVNEPQSYLTATQFAKDIQKLGVEAGFLVETWEKEMIEQMEMGGLLAVNKGSVEDPTFSILKHHPKEAVNKKPIVLVGKGIVYDTGGLSLKPTAKSMDFMKSDMGGAAAVVGAIYAIAKAKLPVYVIGLIPATDNRPSLDAYAPGDVITMMSKKTVEVLNTDAEGRLVLADALHYAKSLKPQEVLDAATLTGAAVASFGTEAICGMGNDENMLKQICKSGRKTYERVVPQPFWDEYAEGLKSSIADITNLGPREAGHITAGKFLENFVDYPWIHLDIAGPAFKHAKKNYQTVGGTGVGVRLFFDYLKDKV
ncbi:MAG: leucyl aminopeptidase [Flavobacteriales bacterium]|jgi:leucyl aminopeptidase|nr:leucyl aminopeptidase [Flavobacteriales bacterium]